MFRSLATVVVGLALFLAPANVEAYWGRHWHGYRTWGGVGLNVSVGYRPVIYQPAYVATPYFGYGYGGYGYGYNAFYTPAYYYSVPGYYSYPAYYYYSPGVYYSPNYCYPAWYGSAPTININNVIVRRSEPALKDPVDKPVVERSSVEAIARARAHIRLGDASFADGRYVDALTRYRAAAESAPNYAEAHFRKGHAYLGHGNFELASASFRKALALDPAAARPGFTLATLYGKDSVAHGVHLENLAAAALIDESSPDAYFLLGLMLRFSGDSARAEKFFAKAASLAPEIAPLLARFETKPPAATDEVPVSLELGDEI